VRNNSTESAEKIRTTNDNADFADMIRKVVIIPTGKALRIKRAGTLPGLPVSLNCLGAETVWILLTTKKSRLSRRKWRTIPTPSAGLSHRQRCQTACRPYRARPISFRLRCCVWLKSHKILRNRSISWRHENRGLPLVLGTSGAWPGVSAAGQSLDFTYQNSTKN
jgi:hypothetical protein